MKTTITYNNQVVTDVTGSSIPIVYNGSTILTISNIGTITLNVQSKLMSHNIIIGEKTMTTQGCLMQSNIILTTVSDWIDPSQSGSTLNVQQVYSATQSGTELGVT